MRYHLVAATGSHFIWFMSFRYLIMADMTLLLAIPYTFGTVSGSLTGVKLSMIVEKWLGATADGHLEKEYTADEIIAEIGRRQKEDWYSGDYPQRDPGSLNYWLSPRDENE